jgi:hypothetical protein
VAEGGALLRRYRGLTSIEGSNPSFSAQPSKMCLVVHTKRAPAEAPFALTGGDRALRVVGPNTGVYVGSMQSSGGALGPSANDALLRSPQ